MPSKTGHIKWRILQVNSVFSFFTGGDPYFFISAVCLSLKVLFLFLNLSIQQSKNSLALKLKLYDINIVNHQFLKTYIYQGSWFRILPSRFEGLKTQKGHIHMVCWNTFSWLSDYQSYFQLLFMPSKTGHIKWTILQVNSVFFFFTDGDPCFFISAVCWNKLAN